MTAPSQPAAFRCADAARSRRDPLTGTAAPARRWLLIEHPGPWSLDAPRTPPLDGPEGLALGAAAAANAARVLLVRRHGRRRSRSRLRWLVVDGDSGRAVLGRWSTGADLLGAIPSLNARADPVTWRPSPSLLLVCAHGVHDVCCAVRGRPVAAALHRRWPESTWECSHVGGDRFAANLVVLPDGACYGNLDEVNAVGVVGDHLRGAVDTAYLRGLSTQPPPMQAALIDALQRFGPAGVGDAVGVLLERTGPARWTAHLAGTGPMPARMEATVVRDQRPAAHLTCRAAAPSSAAGYTVVAMRTGE